VEQNSCYGFKDLIKGYGKERNYYRAKDFNVFFVFIYDTST